MCVRCPNTGMITCAYAVFKEPLNGNQRILVRASCNGSGV